MAKNNKSVPELEEQKALTDTEQQEQEPQTEPAPEDAGSAEPIWYDAQHINIDNEGEQHINIGGEGQQHISIRLRDEKNLSIKGKKNIGRRKKQDYFSDSMKDSYYKKSWRELCEEAGTAKTEDTDFMDILVQSLRDTDRHKNKHKKKYFFLEIILILCAFVNTVLNSAKVIPSASPELDTVLNFACILLSAFIAFITSYEFLVKPKETWLRQMSFYINVTTEADRLFSGAEEYKCSARERIDKFKNKIVDYTNEDYQNFLANMSGTRKNDTQDNKQ